jgi:hypothetical protein
MLDEAFGDSCTQRKNPVVGGVRMRRAEALVATAGAHARHRHCEEAQPTRQSSAILSIDDHAAATQRYSSAARQRSSLLAKARV